MPPADARTTFSVWQREAIGQHGEASRGQVVKGLVCQTARDLESFKVCENF